MYYPLPGELS